MRLLWLLSVLFPLTDETTPPAILSVVEPAREWSFCIPDLGCVNTTEEWYHTIYRPHNPLPNNRHTVKTNFIMFRKGGNKDGESFTTHPESIRAVGFNASLETVLLIHDFTSNGHTGWIKHVNEVMQSEAERNVVSVDWESGALPPYVQAVANSRVVALEIAALLRVLESNLSVSAGALHLVGHGLGAHVAGYVGVAVRGVKRITGLDPSGPLFENMPWPVRLDAGDAAFVDVIHTDVSSRSEPALADGHGIEAASGHLDFYPNGGRRQPGCTEAGEMNLMKVTRDSVPGGSVLPACSHKRAFKYFIESISAGDCQFLAFHCLNYTSFLEGKCMDCESSGAKCAVMGLNSPKYPPSNTGKFYLQTANGTPFCVFTYGVSLHLAKTAKAKTHVSGWMALSLLGKAGPPISMPVQSSILLQHGTTQKMIAYHGLPYVNPVVKAQLGWRYKTNFKHIKTLCLLCNDSLFVDMLVITSMPLTPAQNETTVALCSCDGAPYAIIKSNSSHVFVPCSVEQVKKWHTIS